MSHCTNSCLKSLKRIIASSSPGSRKFVSVQLPQDLWSLPRAAFGGLLGLPGTQQDCNSRALPRRHFLYEEKPREGSWLSDVCTSQMPEIWKTNFHYANVTCTVCFAVQRIDAGNFWWLYIYICMYMYRGSSYINWLFIPECRCLLCSLSQPCGCSLAVCERLLVKPFQKFNNLLEFHVLSLVPAPLAETGLCLLQLSLGGEKGDLAEGQLWSEWNLCSCHVGCLDVVNVLITEAVIEHMDLGFSLIFATLDSLEQGWVSSQSKVHPMLRVWGAASRVCMYVYMHICIYLYNRCAPWVFLWW